MFLNEVSTRFSIDLGIPIVSVPQLMQSVVDSHGVDPEFDHPFFEKVKKMVEAGDRENLRKEKIPLKMLRLTSYAQEGFVLIDYPYELGEAELMEEFKGGLNAFVHLSLPDEVLVDIEENKIVC